RKRWANSPTVRGPVISNFDGRTGACFSRTFDFLSCFLLRPFCPRTEAADFLVRSFSSEPSGTRFGSAGLDFLRAERLELAVGAVAAFADELDADGPFPRCSRFCPAFSLSCFPWVLAEWLRRRPRLPFPLRFVSSVCAGFPSLDSFSFLVASAPFLISRKNCSTFSIISSFITLMWLLTSMFIRLRMVSTSLLLIFIFLAYS